MNNRAMRAALVIFLLGLIAAACAAGASELTVTGCVFLDSDMNDVRDPDEKGLAHVAVSDGVQIVFTDAEGNYTLQNVDREKTRFVFVVTPAGYDNFGYFYQRLPSEGDRFTADFMHRRLPDSGGSFTFAQITDVHVIDESETFSQDIGEVVNYKPSFIIATGDLVNIGPDRSQYDIYTAIISDLGCTVYNVIGNHDRDDEKKAEAEMFANYEEYLGPTYYSFDSGKSHFIVLNCLLKSEAQKEWLLKDLSMLGRGKSVFVFQHYAPDEKLMDLLAEHKAKAVFTGHWHTNKLFDYKGVLYVNTTCLRRGSIDSSPRGFRLIEVRGDKLDITDVWSGCARRLSLVSPVPSSHQSPRAIKVVAASYDSAWPVKGVRYSIDGGTWEKMKQSGKWTWEASASCGVGLHTIRLRAEFDDETIETRPSAFTVSAGPLSTPEMGSDWPMFKESPARTSLAADSVSPPLRMAWCESLGVTTNISSPIVFGETLFIGADDDELKDRSGVYALDAVTGKRKWFYRTDSSIKHTLAASDGLVYGATVKGTVYALNADSGKAVWTYSLGSGIDRWIFHSPLVKDGIVYVGTAPVFVALDAKTGKLVWQAEKMGGDWISSLSSPTAGGWLLFADFNWNRGLHGIGYRDGKSLWVYDTEKRPWLQSTAAYSNRNVFYCAKNNRLIALGETAGNELWNAEAPATIISSPAIDGANIFIGAGGYFLAFDSSTGEKVWSRPVGNSIIDFLPYGRGVNSVVSSPAVSGNTVYIGGTDGRFYALDSATGKTLWSCDLGVPITSSPAVFGNAVYISTIDGTVYAFCEK